MALMRARFLSLLLTTVHGAMSVSVYEEHVLLGLGVLVPFVERLHVHRGELPLPDGVDLPDREPGALLGR